MRLHLALALVVLCPACCSVGDDVGEAIGRSIAIVPLALIEALTPKPLFDGQSLDGWTTSGGRYDGSANWTVEDGALTGRQGPNGEGGLIYTRGEYSQFAFACEFKVEEPMDSGVFLCMLPELRGYQVTIDTPQGGELGGIDSDGWLQHNPDGWKHFKQGEWNLLVIVKGRDPKTDVETITAHLNDEPLVRFEIPADASAFAPAGHIGLQVRGGQDMPPSTKVQFRKIEILGEDLAQRSASSGTR